MAYNYLGKLVSAVLSFFTFTYIVKAVSVEEYGFYSSIINIIFFITLILGIPEIVLRYFPEYMEKKDPYIMKEILSRCLKLIFRGSAILVIAALILLFSFHNNAAVNSFLRFTPFLVILGSLKVLSLVFSNILNAFLSQREKRMVISHPYGSAGCSLDLHYIRFSPVLNQRRNFFYASLAFFVETYALYIFSVILNYLAYGNPFNHAILPYQYLFISWQRLAVIF